MGALAEVLQGIFAKSGPDASRGWMPTAPGVNAPELLLRENWQWALGERPLRPVVLTPFGDWFLEEGDGLAIFFFETWWGSLEPIGPRRDLPDAVRDPRNRQRWFFESQLRLLREQKRLLRPGLCYGWEVSPGLGGSTGLDNIVPTAIALHQHLQSRMACLARSVPLGTRVTSEMIDRALEHDPNDGPLTLSAKPRNKAAAAPLRSAARVASIGAVPGRSA
jgi:hypothetical protein